VAYVIRVACALCSSIFMLNFAETA
jgi:hypothetical protein